MKITQFDRLSLIDVRAKMNQALALLEEVGVHAEVGHMSFESDRATVKVQISVIGEGGEVVTQEAADYDRYREMYDLPELGSEFVDRGETYTITGFKPRSTKYPVLVTRADGKRFKFPVITVRAHGAMT
jgi:hypothetical protein